MSEKSLEVKASARLRLKFDTVEEAEIALRSIQPDNHPLPKGLSIHMEAKENEVYILVDSTRTILSLLTTLDDILAMMNLVVKSVKTIVHKI